MRDVISSSSGARSFAGAVKNRLRGRDEQGFTLIELLVVMIVLGLAIAIVFSTLIKTQRLTRDIASTADSASEARAALADIDRQVRSGNVLYSPANEPAELASCTASGTNAGSCMRVYTQANGAERCVQWQVIADGAHPGSNLLRTRSWSPDWQTDGLFTSWKTVARGLSPIASTAPFTLVTTSNYASRLLDIRIEAVDKRRGTGTTVISSSLAGRNTNYGYDPGQCRPEPTG